MSVAELVRQADADELMWALLVEHADGRVEMHAHDGTAMQVFDRASTETAMSEWLLMPSPVSCAELPDRVDVLDYCARCEPS